MSVFKSLSVAMFCAAGLAALGAKANAATIPVVNSQFDMFPTVATTFAGFMVGPGAPHPYLFFGCGTGCAFADDNVVGWTSSGTFSPGVVSGQFQIGSVTNRFNGPPMIDATHSEPIVVRAQNASLSQIVSTKAVAGATYTLDVDLGFDKGAVDKGFMELIVGNEKPVLLTPVGNLTQNQMQETGNWFDFEGSYTATAADAGAPIEILLSSINNGQGFAYFANVRLTDSLSVSTSVATPEPATWAMMLIGFAGLGFVGYRRARQPRAA